MSFVIGISGASGIILSYLLIEKLTAAGERVSIVMTRDASLTAQQELGSDFATAERIVSQLPPSSQQRVEIFHIHDFMAPIASGSHQTKGMVIVPCSMATMAAVSMGLSDNVLRRAADVTIKEGRKLVVVPREAPFNSIHLENMLKLSKCGVSIFPPIPAWYAHPKTLREAEEYLVNRILDQLGVNVPYQRWGSSSE
jgi:4-hydroxy-3-polyprenylbenzoate decarboxylase